MTAPHAPARLPTPLRLVIAMVLALAAGLYALTWLIGREADRLMSERTITAIAGELQGLRKAMDEGGLDGLADAIRQRPGTGTILYLRSVDGVAIAANIPAPPEPVNGQPHFYRYAITRGAGATPDASVRYLAAGVAVPAVHGATLYVLRDVEDARAFADRIRSLALWAAGLLATAGLGAGLLLSRRIDRRLGAITAATRAYMDGDLGRRIVRDGSRDEIDTLSADLNVLLERIEELMSALREVSDNIAHDLKTPLTRLRNRAEAALRDTGDANAHRAGLENTIEEADGLIQTFNALLLIARLEAGAVEATKEDTDLSALVADVAELYQPVADEAGLVLTTDIAPHLAARLNRQLVGQALANMLDNAIKYASLAPAAPEVVLRASTRPDGAIALSVADRGPGIPAEERERVLKRFVRLEKSRSRPGTGLGLSLVAAVARLHNGTVELGDNAPGLVITLSLPAHAAASGKA
ncbi:MAG TPA: HAMP domain-containing sensor histidine kinase [Hyphomicrobiaceae bacterium]|nr:HAMP domain-containing sensor histidine kinase [Hyphomicrobiaceae bacterium]